MSISEITLYVVGLTALLAAIRGFWEQLRKVFKQIIKPLWIKAIKPYGKLCVAFASLFVPNGLFIGGLLFLVARYYWEADSLDMILTDRSLFLKLIAAQALLVSLYSCIWGIWLYPKMRDWFVVFKSEATEQPATVEEKQKTSDDSESDGNQKPSDDSQGVNAKESPDKNAAAPIESSAKTGDTS